MAKINNNIFSDLGIRRGKTLSFMLSSLLLLFFTACVRDSGYIHPSKSADAFSSDQSSCQSMADKQVKETGWAGNSKKSAVMQECLNEKGWVRKQRS